MAHTYTVTRTSIANGECIKIDAEPMVFTSRQRANDYRAAWIAEDAAKITSDWSILMQSHSVLAYASHPGEMGESIHRIRVEYDVMHTNMALATIAI